MAEAENTRLLQTDACIGRALSVSTFPGECLQMLQCCCFNSSLIATRIDEAVIRMEKNPSADQDTLSILEKLLKVDRNAAFTMSMDSLFAGVDTVR